MKLPPSVAGPLIFALVVSAAAVPSSGAPSGQRLRLKSGSFDPLTEERPVPEALRAAAGSRASVVGEARHLVVQFAGSVTAAESAAVERAGGRVLAYVPDGALLVRLSPAGLAALREDAARPGAKPLRWAGRLEPRDRLEPGLLGARPESVVVTLFPEESRGAFRAQVAAALSSLAGIDDRRLAMQDLGTPSAVLGSRIRLSLHGGFPEEALAAIVLLEPVWYVEPFREARPLNDDTIWVGQSHDLVARRDYSVSATIWNHGLLGSGQVAGAIDTGLEADSCFFKKEVSGAAPQQHLLPPALGTLDPDAKLRALYVLPGHDPHASRAHGTGSMGILVGDDFTTLSTPTDHGHDPGDGMAPNAQLVAQVPLAIANSLPDAFTQAHDSGVRIHSNSWVSGWNFYTEPARQADAFAWEHEEFLAFFGAGNTGGSPNNRLVGAPSVAKNVVSVGGCSPGSVNDAEDLADRSRGPAFDGRIKPDLVAPAAGIVTAGGDGLPGTNDCVRAGFGGTSAATPAVAGLALLVRQYFTDGFHPSGLRRAGDEVVPSAALIKACLLNGATPLLGVDPATGASVDPVPSFNQGWGRVLLDGVLWFQGDGRTARYWDVWNAAGLATGETAEYSVAASPGEPLEVTLVWTDPPAAPSAAAALVHDLDLEVVSPSGTTWLGNRFVGGESVPGGAADATNNVEAVLIRDPEAGSHRIRVVGRSIPPAGVARFGDRQGYALVATTASCDSSLAPPANLAAEDRGASGVLLTWDPVPGAAAYTVLRGDGDCAEAAGRFSVLGPAETASFTDARAEGGLVHSYRVRAADDCGESEASACVMGVATGPCRIAPAFEGARAAETDGLGCAVRLVWNPAVSACPLGPLVSYNVYRSSRPDFVPAPAELLAAGVGGSEFVDSTAPPGVTSFYVVRAEDSTRAGGGPAGGGNEDGNLVRVNATPEGPPGASGTWTDDGGDTAARLGLGSEWSLSDLQNHTPAGSSCYRTGRPGALYPSGACTALVSPPLELEAAASPLLSYWVSYNLEESFDGVVVELSDNGGASWIDLPPDAGYPGDLSLTDEATGARVNACSYPASQGAFSGPPGNAALSGWQEFTTDLSAWAGRSVRLRFRLATDAVIEGPEGLYLDDLSVTGVLLPTACAPCTRPGPVGAGLRVAKAPPADVLFTWTDVAEAAGYRLTGSLDPRLASVDFTTDAPDGASGAAHEGALGIPATWYYRVRAIDSCGGLGP